MNRGILMNRKIKKQLKIIRDPRNPRIK